jgi:hypothetical protein
MFTTIWTAIRRRAQPALQAIRHRLLAWTRPTTGPRLGSIAGDLTRTKTGLVAANAFLRQQLVVRARQVKRPLPTPADRRCLVLLALCWPFGISVRAGRHLDASSAGSRLRLRASSARYVPRL